jgi:Fe-S cluster biogenesis protein NfuA
MNPLDSLLERMEELLNALDELGEHDRSMVFELLDGIDTLHRHALVQLVEGLAPETIERLRAGNEAVAWLFEAYGIGIDQHAAAERALEEIRPYIHSHGGRVELVDVADGVVRLRMSGACAGCTASAATLSEGIEQALREHLPGFAGLEAEQDSANPHPPPGPVLLQLERRPPENWQ